MRRLLLSFALAMSLCALGASTALGAPEGAQKVPLYAQVGFCFQETPPTSGTFGFAVLNTPGDEMTLSGGLALKGVKPNTTYQIIVFDAVFTDCFRRVIGMITTNRNGNGNLHFTIERLISGELLPTSTSIGAQSVVDLHEWYASPAVELD
jgi:hypothetical protein